MSKKVISVPIYIRLAKSERGKKYSLNLNSYRNWHHQVSNSLKVKFKELVWFDVKDLKFTKPITLTFTLYKSSRRRIDRSNFCCIVEKFFCDALTEYGCIPDDNDEFITETRYRTGGIDPKNPRIEITIQ